MGSILLHNCSSIFHSDNDNEEDLINTEEHLIGLLVKQ
jgi:hypothetical protein